MAVLICGTATVLPVAAGGENPLSVARIPPALKKDAGAVIRNYTLRFEIKNERRAWKKVKQVVTIFEKDQRHYGELMLRYDKFKKIDGLKGTMYNASGKQIRDLRKKDIKDYSTFSDRSLHEDSRVRVSSLYHDRYPYTVEFTYEISYDGFLNWPTWYAQESKEPVEHSRFEVLVPKDYDLRFWCNRDTVRPRISEGRKKKLYAWQARNLPKRSKDAFGDELEKVTIIVRIAPAGIELEGYSGGMTSWKRFVGRYHKLSRGNTRQPEAAVRRVQALVDPSADALDKTRKLYRYMQSSTRYVSVPLGIRCWQQFDATYVHERGYGDCKAFSDYTAALLARESSHTSDVQLTLASAPTREAPSQ